MMKGIAVSFIAAFVMAIISLGIFFVLTGTLFSGEAHDTYMSMPKGVWMSMESADTKTFVLPPVVWFGEKLIVDGDTTLDFGKVYDETNRDSRDFVFPTNNVYIKEYVGITVPKNKEYLPLLANILFSPSFISVSIPSKIIFDVRKPISPVIAFYPLVTDDFGSSESLFECNSEVCHLNTEESFGKVNLTLTIDVGELQKYYKSKNYRFDESFDNVNLSVKYVTDKYSKQNNYIETLGLDKNSLSITDLKDLDDIYGNKICKEVLGKYECSFVFNVADKCCPSFASIEPVLEVQVTAKDGVKVWETEKIDPIYFQIVYYLDVFRNTVSYPRNRIYNFVDSTNNKAYYGKDLSDAAPVNVNRLNWITPGVEFGVSDYTAISSSDDVYFSTSTDLGKSQQLVHDFVFKINRNPSKITDITLTWEGYGSKGDEAIADNDLRMYLLNINTNTFELVDSKLDNSCPGSEDCQMTCILTEDFSNYINDTGHLRFLVQKNEALFKELGWSCSSPDECSSGYCVNEVCCNSSCLGSTCQRCDSYSVNGAGYCGYVSSSLEDPDNECDTSGCGTGNCKGDSYVCGYYTSGEHNCSVCYTCDASGNCNAAAVEGTRCWTGSWGSCGCSYSDTCDESGTGTKSRSYKTCSSGSCSSSGSESTSCTCSRSTGACCLAGSLLDTKSECEAAGCDWFEDTKGCCDAGLTSCGYSSGNYACSIKSAWSMKWNGENCECTYCDCSWCCCPPPSPFIYIYNGSSYKFISDFIAGAISPEKEYTSFTDISNSAMENNRYKIKITEELDEITYLDKIYLKITDMKGNNRIIYNVEPYGNLPLIGKSDDNYLILNKGDEVFLEFDAPELKQGYKRKIEFAAEGYYIENPKSKILSSKQTINYKSAHNEDIWVFPGLENPFEKFLKENNKKHNSLYTDYVKVEVNSQSSTSHLSQFISENFQNIQEDLFKDDSGRTPVKDILIYPCRAKVPNGIEVSNLYKDVKDFEGKEIYWDDCSGNTEFIRLEYLDWDPNIHKNSTWFCMEEDGNYYLYNPYAFCRLDGTELPVSPKPTYLRGIIPYSNFAKKVDNIPFYLGPLWIPKEGWNIYWARTPEFDYKTYKESAWVCAVSIIDNVIEAMKNNEDVIFFKNMEINGVTITYNFN